MNGDDKEKKKKKMMMVMVVVGGGPTAWKHTMPAFCVESMTF